ncbi:O-antigen polysaccharide polymerase Wzy [Porphyromonas sp. COT-239 OH1446]|uniref:O-antigen polysaccharide polymerase Wzy n=1 Tax=Porphyromonas sp. COT-239 OH1446 TaxID=1515613 RepID=UPI00052B683F|nr:O-antigen polysaccharide polymerase Wzy [Porphyromonas sp. COT-239 OH1446]KGN70210.1 hypothetical protein HQ37_03970 [Porphyromonas sp. COT-239 OH1446]
MVRDGRRGIRILAFFLLLFSLFFRLVGSFTPISPELVYLISLESAIFMPLIIFSLTQWLKGFFRIVIIFLLLFFLYMQGQLFLNAIGALSTPLLMGKFSLDQVMDAVMDVHLYLSFFLFGLTLPKQDTRTQEKYVSDQHAVQVGYWILLLSFPFYLYVNATKLFFVFTYGYASLYQEVALNAIPSGLKILSYFYLPGAFYVLFGAENRSKHEKIALFLILAHCLVQLFMGYRSATITPVLLIFYAVTVKKSSYRVRTLKKKWLFYIGGGLAALVIFFIFPAMRKTRNDGGIATASAKEIFTSDQSNSFETVYDMGKSLQTVVYTKELVPKEYPFRYGVTYIMNLTSVFPNLFWDKHPAETYGTLGRWITKIVDRNFYDFGGALGYSCVAESYINFGYFGLILIPLVFGYILQRAENRALALNSPITYASLAIICIYLSMYPRGEFADLVRGIFWYMFIPRYIYKLTKK